DDLVTGVQTCALPISPSRGGADPAVANEPGGPAGVLEHLIFLSDGVFAIARSTARMAISAARCAAIAPVRPMMVHALGVAVRNVCRQAANRRVRRPREPTTRRLGARSPQ